ncbi:FkbM family methyltransferase [Geminocystis herdmanii]|uniref:FkbM family methyltransferase n=1 Tax=Geminocystis herdmanii TaxID=669359 RepID=UPI00034B4494|nr:FkbM family methyltransferase [Geminocystis herdmanii]
MSIFAKKLKDEGYLDNLHFTIMNVGSRKLSIQDDYSNQGWGIFAPNLSIYGFDADEDACNQANEELQQRGINWQEQHIPLGLSDSIGEKELYVTKAPMCSSLYPPNESYLARFQGLPELVNLDFSIGIETTTLDAFCLEEKIHEIDFLQIDVQGADLDVLKGAINLLNKTISAIQIEVEFSHLYLNQPLFSDVDIFLRNQKFSLFDIFLAHRPRHLLNVKSSKHPHGQLLWGDAFYLRDLLSENFTKEVRSPLKLLKLACVADVLGFYDYALELLIYLTNHYGDDQQYNFSSFID